MKNFIGKRKYKNKRYCYIEVIDVIHIVANGRVLANQEHNVVLERNVVLKWKDDLRVGGDWIKIMKISYP